MKIAVLAINSRSQRLAEHLGKLLPDEVTLLFPRRHNRKTANLVKECFTQFQGWIFIAPLGLVIRVIAPQLQSKHDDPAVVVVDELGRFCISVLCGHEGGANALAAKVAAYLGAEAVITTSTEARRRLIVGLGCRRGVPEEEIILAINKSLNLAEKSLEDVRKISTIDLKRDEPGIWAAAEILDRPLGFIPRDLLRQFSYVKEEEWITKRIGVGAVAEPCAILGGKHTRLILPKQRIGKVTVALAEESFIW